MGSQTSGENSQQSNEFKIKHGNDHHNDKDEVSLQEKRIYHNCILCMKQ